MNTEELFESETETLESKSSDTCPDYDDDCVDIEDPFFCWMGTKNCERAKGLCPLVHTTN